MISKKYWAIISLLLFIQNIFGQINISNKPLLSSDSYTRNAVRIKLLPGFSYRADATVTTPAAGVSPYLLNLNISDYPAFVPSSYISSAVANCGLTPTSILNTPMVGETVGNFAVSPSGAAIYNIPIYAPPGTSNVEPRLSIRYNSDVKDGLLGIGWNLVGLSFISRVNKTPQLDGKFEAVQLGINDQFSLDGTRLMTKSGVYGANGSTYSTENETFSTIISNGSSGNGPSSFEVTDKFGNKMQYGLGNNSTLKGIGDNSILMWFLNRVTDEFGNFMNYSYKNVNGEIIIDNIEYTMNNGAGQTTPYNTVNFEYTEKAEKNSFYTAGKEFRNSKLLKSITSMAEGKLARKYVFDYKFDRVTLLWKITEIASDGSELRPTTFCWSDPFSQTAWSNNDKAFQLFSSQTEMNGLLKVISADMNGDGFADALCTYTFNNTSQPQFRLKVTSVDNTGSKATNPDLSFTTINTTANATFINSKNILSSTVIDSDFDGDQEIYLLIDQTDANAKQYIVQKVELGGPLLVTNVAGPFLTTNNINVTQDPSPFYYEKADFTGDGILDELIIDPDKIMINSAQGNLQDVYVGGNPIVRSIDFDGDGVLELLLLDDQIASLGIKILKYVVGNPFLSLVHATTIPYSGNSTVKLHNLAGLGDYNGDGKTDIAYLNLNNSDLNIIYSNGVGFTSAKKVGAFTSLATSQYILPSGEYYNISSPDVNSDGKSDIIITSKVDKTATGATENYFSYFSGGDVFSKGPVAAGLWTYFEFKRIAYRKKYEIINGVYNYNFWNGAADWKIVDDKMPVFVHNFDLNGDGNFDAISLKDFTHQRIVFNNITASKSDYLYQIITGLGKQVTISYANTNTEFNKDQELVYTNDNPVSYSLPLVRLKPNKWVVNKVNYTSTFIPLGSINDPQISNTYRYGYYNAVYHKEGKGFLGFERIISFHENTMIGTQNKNIFDPIHFIPLNSENITAIIKKQNFTSGLKIYSVDNSKPLSSKTNITYQISNTPSPNSYFVAPQSVIQKDYLSSIASKTDLVYDLSKAGNVASSNTEYFWKVGDPITYSVNTTYNYQQEGLAANKIFKLKNVILKSTHKDDPGNQYNRFTEYTYDGLGHLIEISKDPLISGHNVKTIFPSIAYNSFGQPTHIELSGDAPTNRFADVQYDSKGRFITKTINSSGHTNELIYEPVYGNIIQTKDITGLVSTFRYDGLGRITESHLPNGAINYQTYDYQIPAYSNNNRNGVYAATTINEGTSPSINYFDSYGRMLRNETKGFGNKIVYTDLHYDGEGRLWQQTEPHYSTQAKFLVAKNTYTDLPSPDVYFRLTKTEAYHRDLTITTLSEPTATLLTNYRYSNPSNDATHISGFISVANEAAEETKTFMNVAGQTSTLQTINGGNAFQNSVYTYTCNGQPKQINLSYGSGNFTSGLVQHKFQYDLLGRQIILDDPSAGITSYVYNAIGELTQQTDGSSNVYTYQYDDLGRLKKKTGSSEGITDYQYITSGNGLEALQKIIHANVTTEFQYDNLNRLTEYKKTLPSSKIFKSNYTYDKYGRVTDYKYPSGFTTKSFYDAEGYLAQIKNAANNFPIWQLDDVNALDQIKQYTYGNGLQTTNSFDAIHQTTLTTNNALTQNYKMQAGGPAFVTFMEKRSVSNGMSTLQEKFTYDQQQRLSSFVELDASNNPIPGTLMQTQIDFKGNITKKDDAGDFVYGNTNKPFTLTGINNPQTNISLNTLNVIYNDFNKVKQINEASTLKQMDFTYGNDEQRLKVDYKINGINQYTRYYCDDYEREETPSSTFKEWNYIFAPSGLAAVLYNNNGTENLYFAETDHLGSPIALTNSSQNIAEEYSFDAWGRRRNPNNWSDYNVNPTNFILKRGFTFHEHIDEFNLINMNGRVYDPVLGRFIQPDNIVQNPDNISTFNRYSYVMNNPLKYIDPSGWGGEGSNQDAYDTPGYGWSSPMNPYHPGNSSSGFDYSSYNMLWYSNCWSGNGSGGGSGGGTSGNSYTPGSYQGGSTSPATSAGYAGGGGSPMGGGPGRGGGGGTGGGGGSSQPRNLQAPTPTRDVMSVSTYQSIQTNNNTSNTASVPTALMLTAGQMAFNEIMVPIMLAEPTPFGEAAVAVINTGFLIYNAVTITENATSIMLEFSKGKGERNKASKADGTDNPFKKLKPDPNKPGNVLVKDSHTGKTVSKPAPPGFKEYWKTKK